MGIFGFFKRELFGPRRSESGAGKPKEKNRRPPWADAPRKPAIGGLMGRTNPATYSTAEVEDFVYGGDAITVASSNVGMIAQYFIEQEKLMLEFHGGRDETRAYLYSDIPPEMAFDFAAAPSKGEWVWDNLRVRGTQDQHRKPYVRIK